MKVAFVESALSISSALKISRLLHKSGVYLTPYNVCKNIHRITFHVYHKLKQLILCDNLVKLVN